MVVELVVGIPLALFALIGPWLVFRYKYNKGMFPSVRRAVILHTLVSIFFAFTVCVFAFMHRNWDWGTVIHTWGFVMAFIAPFAMAYLCKGTKRARTVTIVFAVILFISPISRPFIWWAHGAESNVAAWEYAIPVNVCTIATWLFLPALLLNNKTVMNFMITVVVFGGIINNIQVWYVGEFWYYYTWETYWVHAILITIPIFMILTNQVTPSYRHFLYNLFWLVPVFLLAGLLFNPLWGTNWHFTAPFNVTEMVLPTMSNPWIFFGNAVDPLHMAGVLLGAVGISSLIYLGMRTLYRRVRPQFTVQSDQIEHRPNNNTDLGDDKGQIGPEL
ncbi:MAG: YwaF family protein [Firmicutes bacterium]|nr:YwaF family protein [Bacillota bacterium]